MAVPAIGDLRRRGDSFDQTVLLPIRALGRRLRASALGAGLATLMIAGTTWVLLDLGVDWLFRLGVPMRAVLLAAGLVALGLVFARRVFRPLTNPLRVDELAIRIESRHPELNDVLVSAVQLSNWPQRGRYSAALLARLRDEACHKSSAIDFLREAEVKPLRYRAVLASSAVVTLAMAGILLPAGTMQIWLMRNVALADVDWPKRTRLTVAGAESGRLLHPKGDDLEVTARLVAGSVRPRRVLVRFRFASGAEGGEPMTSVGEDQYRFVFPRIVEPLEFRLSGGDEITPWVRVDLAERPNIERIEISITPPPYTGGETYRLPTNQSSMRVLAGSRVVIGFDSNVALESAELRTEDGVLSPVQWSGQRGGYAELVALEDLNCWFRLVDGNGLENVRPVRIAIRIQKDRPPTVRMEIAGGSGLVTPDAVLPVLTAATDEYGLAETRLNVEVPEAGGTVREIPLSGLERGAKEHQGEVTWSVSESSAVPGDQIALWASAWDLDDVTGPNEGRSFRTRLRVVTAEELLADVGRREQEYRMEFERILNAQEDLRGTVLSEVAGSHASPRADATSARRLLAEPARMQRQLTKRVGGIGGQFEQILIELRVNGLAGPAVASRLYDGIIEPLQRLEKTEMPAASKSMNVAEPDLELLIQRLTLIIEQMRWVLANMIEWEGFQETVVLLRNLIEQQDEMLEETEAELERKVRRLLDGGT